MKILLITVITFFLFNSNAMIYKKVDIDGKPYIESTFNNINITMAANSLHALLDNNKAMSDNNKAMSGDFDNMSINSSKVTTNKEKKIRQAPSETIRNINGALQINGLDIKFNENCSIVAEDLVGNSLDNYYIGRVKVTDVDNNVVFEDVYVPDVAAFMDFMASYGEINQGPVYSYNDDTIVNTADLLIAINSFGDTAPPEYQLPNLENACVLGKFSSGWFLDMDDWEASFIKVTPIDEIDNSNVPSPINTFFFEGYKEGQFYKIYFYSKSNI